MTRPSFPNGQEVEDGELKERNGDGDKNVFVRARGKVIRFVDVGV